MVVYYLDIGVKIYITLNMDILMGPDVKCIKCGGCVTSSAEIVFVSR